MTLTIVTFYDASDQHNIEILHNVPDDIDVEEFLFEAQSYSQENTYYQVSKTVNITVQEYYP